MRKTHAHDCRWKLAGCKNQVECGGELERNHDGWPDTICREEMHGPGLTCQECHEAEQKQCPDCGTWAFHLGETHDIDCAHRPKAPCPVCQEPGCIAPHADVMIFGY